MLPELIAQIAERLRTHFRWSGIDMCFIHEFIWLDQVLRNHGIHQCLHRRWQVFLSRTPCTAREAAMLVAMSQNERLQQLTQLKQAGHNHHEQT